MVFQNPFDTLNPSHSIGGQIVRVLEKFRVGKSNAEREARMLELLDLVKLPRAFARRMPRQLSGGQKQRIGIARAFAGAPQVVVADEPVSALDVSVQAAVTELLTDIQRDKRTTMLFISHDLGIVRYLADRVMVMYLGHVVEIGTHRPGLRAALPPLHRGAALGGADRRHQRREGSRSCSRATSPRRSTRRPAARSRPAARASARCRATAARPSRPADGRAGARAQGEVPPVRGGLRGDAAGHPHGGSACGLS